MILEANNQSINFLNFDTTFANKKLMLSLSGGTDSALLLYLFCLYKPDWDIICHTGIDKYKDPWLGEYASDIIHAGGNYMTDGLGTSASSDLVFEENKN